MLHNKRRFFVENFKHNIAQININPLMPGGNKKVTHT